MSKIETHPVEPAPLSAVADRRGGGTLGWLALVVLAGGLAYGAGTRVGIDRQANATTAARGALVPTVRTVSIQRLTGSVPLDLPGSIEPIETAAINARASGYVVKRLADIGQAVRQGDVLAIIQSHELEQQVSQANATLVQAQANRDLAHATAGRSASLIKDGWVTAQKFDEDRLVQNARSADVLAAEAALKGVVQRRDYLTVTAPFDGVVTQRTVEVGDLVSADAAGARPMFTLARTDRVKVEVHVPQDAADGLADGVAASVTVPERPGQAFTGTIARTAHALDSASRTLLVEVDIANPDNTLAAGLYTKVHFDLTPTAPRIRLDANALIYNADGLKLALVDHGTVHLTPIRVGRDFGAEVDIADGLRGGETVVLNPPLGLRDGSAVQLAGG